MIHHLQHIADLVEICRIKCIEQIVVSPGSRNAPLVNLFASNSFFTLHSIVDERAAAFYALGISLATQQPVVILCTSGTAVLNYSPALAEAYYRHIPLIAITADRPEHLIDQQDNQTIRQANVYANFIKDSIHLHTPVIDDYELQAQHHAVNSTINNALCGIQGPVHINVPIAEPLYSNAPTHSKAIKCAPPSSCLTPNTGLLLQNWVKSSKTIILTGQGEKNNYLNTCLNSLASHKRAVVIAEPISNISSSQIISPVDRVMMQIEAEKTLEFEPDLLISTGGAVVSKRVKAWLQKLPELMHIRLASDYDDIDTYNNLKATVTGNINELMKLLCESHNANNSDFCNSWEKAAQTSFKKHSHFLETTPWSDLAAMHFLTENLNKTTVLHFGNSTPVRYAQLFNLKSINGVYANRGVSGIDGSVSTAAGFASQSKDINLLLVGDLSFVYDSNALWNRKLPNNLRIIVINNEGGGIFRLLPGASQINGFENFIETKHPVNIAKIVEAFSLDYYMANSLSMLEKEFEPFMKSNNAAVFEVFTPPKINPVTYSNYVKAISET